jgi:N utilization substance protein A
MTDEQAEEKSEAEASQLLNMFMETLDVDADVAEILVREGFSSLEEVVYVPANEILEIEEFDEDIIEELRNRARDALLTRAISSEEHLGDTEPAEDLLSMDGMDDELAQKLAGRGICTMEDLAEQSVDELTEIEGLDEKRAGELIMAARAPWFAEEAEN